MSSYRDCKEDAFCPVHATLDLLNQRWNLRIVRSLLFGSKRFNEIGREHGINPRTLCARLKSLEVEGIVVRTVVSVNPPNVEYSLSEKGLALSAIFDELEGWGRLWMDPPS